jgi:hypothetical protein
MLVDMIGMLWTENDCDRNRSVVGRAVVLKLSELVVVVWESRVNCPGDRQKGLHFFCMLPSWTAVLIWTFQKRAISSDVRAAEW